jgi:hypothetical protein
VGLRGAGRAKVAVVSYEVIAASCMVLAAVVWVVGMWQR